MNLTYKHKKQHGIAHLFIIIGSVVILTGALGLVFVNRYNAEQAQQAQMKEEAAQKERDQKAAEAAKKEDIASKQAEPAPAAPSTDCARTETRYVTAGVGLSVRSEKSTAAAAVAVAPYASAMAVGCLDGDWYSVDYNGKIGYSLAAHLSTTKPAAQAAPAAPAGAKNPTQANCLPNDGKFTVYASVPSGTPTYWNSSFTTPSGIVVAYKTAMSVHCFDNSIQKLVYGQTDSFVKASDVTTTKP